MNPITIFGTAIDGPNDSILVSSYNEAMKYFAGYITERFEISSTDTELTLLEIPWNSRIRIEEELSDGSVVDLNYWEFSGIEVNGWTIIPPENPGRTIYFNAFGRDLTILVSYRREPTNINLLDQVATLYLSGYNGICELIRIGGTTAKLDMGGVLFESKYSGSKYNNASITFTAWDNLSSSQQSFIISKFGSAKTYGLIITNPPRWSKYPMEIIGFDSIDEIITSVNSYASRGRSSLQASQGIDYTNENYVPISEGTFSLSGGTDSLNSNGDDSILDLISIIQNNPPDSKVLCMSGWNIESIMNYLNDSIQYWAFPSLVVLSQDITGKSAADLVSESLVNNTQIQIVANNMLIQLPEGDHWMNIGPAYAGALANEFSSRSGSTWYPIKTSNFDPIYSTDDLNLLSSNGRVALTKSVKLGPVIFSGVTSDPSNDWTIPVWKIYQRIYESLQNHLLPFVGNAYSEDEISSEITAGLSNISGVLNIDASAYFEMDTGILNIAIVFQPVGELTSFSVSLSIKL